MGRGICNAAVAVLLMAAPAAAQSLGDLARNEEARRASAQNAAKMLSNADLAPSAIVAAAGAAAVEVSCYMSMSKGRCVSADEMVSNSVAGSLTRENAPHEERFRRDAESIRTQIEKTQASMATLDVVVADETRSPSDRQGANKALARARQALAGFERQWEKLESAASQQRIPRKWIEPIPSLTTRTPQ